MLGEKRTNEDFGWLDGRRSQYLRNKNKEQFFSSKYNQNHSIQGTIQWLEQKKTIYFRSLMELVLLLQEAASNNMEFRSWNGEKGIIKELLSPKQPTGSE